MKALQESKKPHHSLYLGGMPRSPFATVTAQDATLEVDRGFQVKVKKFSLSFFLKHRSNKNSSRVGKDVGGGHQNVPKCLKLTKNIR